MKDAIGAELEVGDEIVYVDGNGRGSSLYRAIVDGFTPKMVKILRVRFGDTRYYSESGNYGLDKVEIGPFTGFREATVNPCKLVKTNWSTIHESENGL